MLHSLAGSVLIGTRNGRNTGKGMSGWKRKDVLGQGSEEIIFIRKEQNLPGHKEERRVFLDT